MSHPSYSTAFSATPQQYLRDYELIEHFKAIGAPLPFSLSTIQKDRLDGRLGGIPHRVIGKLCLYDPEGVSAWLTGKPIVQPTRRTTKVGRPTAAERAKAKASGYRSSVKAMRAAQAGSAK